MTRTARINEIVRLARFDAEGTDLEATVAKAIAARDYGISRTWDGDTELAVFAIHEGTPEARTWTEGYGWSTWTEGH